MKYPILELLLVGSTLLSISAAGAQPVTGTTRTPMYPSAGRTGVVSPGAQAPTVLPGYGSIVLPQSGNTVGETNIQAAPIVAGPGVPGNRYLLREGDLIEVKVYQEEDLTARVRLNQGGEVTLLLLGNVRLDGKNVEEARRHVQEQLAKDYLVNPQVTITVIEYAKRRFAVLGQVQQPGFYNIPENERLNVLQAISMAGGYTRLANTSRVTIKRNIRGVETVLQVNAQSMASEQGARPVEVQAEDTIVVNQRVF